MNRNHEFKLDITSINFLIVKSKQAVKIYYSWVKNGEIKL